MYSELLLAVKRKDTKRALRLISESADAAWVDCYGSTALIWACNHNMPEVVRELFKTDCLPHQADNFGTTALMLACRQQMFGIALELVGMGCDSTVKDLGNSDAFYHVAKSFSKCVNSTSIRLMFAMRGCHNPTPTQLYEIMNPFNNINNIKQNIDDSIIRRWAFRRWAVRSRLTRLTRSIPRGPVGIILGYL
jgi:ankyrin repeat protein